MIAGGDSESLRTGLRALATLGRAAPLDLAAFAGLTGLTLAAGSSFLGVFESHGYARRVPGGSIFVLTRLGFDLLGEGNAAGRLVSEAIEPITGLSKRLDHDLTLSLPVAEKLLVCVVAGKSGNLPRSGDRQDMPRAVERLLATSTADGHSFCTDERGARLDVRVPLSNQSSAILAVHAPASANPQVLQELLPAMERLARTLAQRHDSGLQAQYPAIKSSSRLLH